MNITALLTGRGNNTLKDKNVRTVLGKPLLYYPAMAAKNSKLINNFYISSEDNKILEAGEMAGYKIIVRPEEYARPDSLHVDAVKHALEFMAGQDRVKPDILVVLLANTVTVKTQWIDECINYIIKDNSLSAAVPVYEDQDHHPYRSKKLNNEGLLEPFFDFSGKKISTNRQDLETSYFLCHNFWVLNVNNSVYSENGQPPWSFMGSRVKPYPVSENFDVHDAEDLKKSETWLIENNINYNT